VENEFELPEYYNTKKPKEKEDLVKRNVLPVVKKKLWASLKDIVMTVADQELQRIIKRLTVFVGNVAVNKMDYYYKSYFLVCCSN
jgi:spore maturation protein SpmB